jgi:hypothetical protein
MASIADISENVDAFFTFEDGDSFSALYHYPRLATNCCKSLTYANV